MKTKFEIGQIVFLRTDNEQLARIVTRYTVCVTGITYELSFGTTTSWHYDFEISENKDVLKSIE